MIDCEIVTHVLMACCRQSVRPVNMIPSMLLRAIKQVQSVNFGSVTVSIIGALEYHHSGCTDH